MNHQPDGAPAVHSVLDPRRRLRFERPKFEQSVGVTRRRNPLIHLKSALNRLGKRSQTARSSQVIWIFDVQLPRGDLWRRVSSSRSETSR
jgi:hypothetical protein